MWNIKYGTNEPITKQIHRENRLVVAKWEEGGGGGIGSLGLVDANYYIWNG